MDETFRNGEPATAGKYCNIIKRSCWISFIVPIVNWRCPPDTESLWKSSIHKVSGYLRHAESWGTHPKCQKLPGMWALCCLAIVCWALKMIDPPGMNNAEKKTNISGNRRANLAMGTNWLVIPHGNRTMPGIRQWELPQASSRFQAAQKLPLCLKKTRSPILNQQFRCCIERM